MTNNIDEILNKPYVNHGEFKVPNGYFDSLRQRIMDSMPEEKAETKRQPVIIRMSSKVKYAVAACLTGLVVCGGTMTFNAYRHDAAVASVPVAPQQTYTTDKYAQDCMDYAMVDDGDMYNYLADQN